MRELQIIFPSWYDELAEFEHEKKGFLEGVVATLDGVELTLNFYDIHRLAQDAGDSISDIGFSFMHNIVIIESVTRVQIERAARAIITGITAKG